MKRTMISRKITAVFFGSCLKEFHPVWNCLFILQNAKLFHHNHLLFERCWGYFFCSIRLSPGCPFHPVVSKSCNRTEFGQTYQIVTVLTYVIFFISLLVFGQYLCILKNPSSASLRIKVTSSCLKKCRRIVSKSVDELSQKTCHRRRHSGIFRYVLPPSL